MGKRLNRGQEKKSSAGVLRFVVQKHYASRLHYDLRLELDGVLLSWAVPKGPSLNPTEKRLAMMVEDHPYDYLDFEGIIPEGNYGAGAVLIWDEGVYHAPNSENPEESARQIREGLAAGNLKFVLRGKKLKGEFALVKIKSEKENSWLLIKKRDYYAQNDFRIAQFTDPFPQKIKPMLAVPVKEPFNHPDWIFEIKLDGYRAIAAVQEGNVNLYSRNLKSFNELFPPIVQALAGSVDAVYDGEIVVIDDKGRSNFQLLQNYTKGAAGNLCYFVFDLLYLDGQDLRRLPLCERKKKLRKFLPQNSYLKYVDEIEEAGTKFFQLATENGLEGIIAKRKASTYREGKRSGDWRKIKAFREQKAVICGFTSPKGSRPYFGSLVLGAYQRGELIYIGNCGTGFSTADLQKIYSLLKPLERNHSPFAEPPKTKEKTTWVEPVYVCKVKFSEWTDDGLLRHAVFLQLCAGEKVKSSQLEHDGNDDGAKRQETNKVTEPVQLAKGKNQEVTVNGQILRLTNLDKVFWPEEEYTKGDVINYYYRIAPYILPYLKDRPQSLYRTPNGILKKGFYQKDVSSFAPDWVETYKIISDGEKKEKHYLLCQNLETLIYMANLGCIEINPWLSRVQRPDYPDYLVIDLDPEEIAFAKVIEAAQAVHAVLARAQIPSFPKTSGATGLHIYIPLGAKYNYEIAREFARLIATLVHHEVPGFTSLERSPKKRKQKVYLDFLQNRSGQTVASVYSLRPREGATVSTPLRWEEIKPGLDPREFTIKTIHRRLQKMGDLFKGVLGPGVDIAQCIEMLKKI
mgnify:FL=1